MTPIGMEWRTLCAIFYAHAFRMEAIYEEDISEKVKRHVNLFIPGLG
jgi:hypothetical protein